MNGSVSVRQPGLHTLSLFRIDINRTEEPRSGTKGRKRGRKEGRKGKMVEDVDHVEEGS